MNGAKQTVDAESDTPLLWVLRDELDLKGSKFGCGVGLLRRVHRPTSTEGSAIMFDAGFDTSAAAAVATIEGIGRPPSRQQITGGLDENSMYPNAAIARPDKSCRLPISWPRTPKSYR